MKRPDFPPEKSYYPPYARDVRNLFVLFLKDNSDSITAFKKVWKYLNFSLMHHSVPAEIRYEVFIDEIFTTILGYLTQPNHQKVRFGVVYAIYLLYRTAIKRVSIPLSPLLFNELMKVREEAKTSSNVDVYQLLLWMMEKNAFDYHAVVEFDKNLSSLDTPSAQIERTTVPDLFDKVDVLKMEHLSSQYQDQKQQFFSGESPYNIVNPGFASEIQKTIDVFREKKEERVRKHRNYHLNMESKIVSRMRDLGHKKNLRNMERKRLPTTLTKPRKKDVSLLDVAQDLLPDDVREVKSENKSSASGKEIDLEIVQEESDNNSFLERNAMANLTLVDIGPLPVETHAPLIPLPTDTFQRGEDDINSEDTQTAVAAYAFNQVEMLPNRIRVPGGKIELESIKDEFMKNNFGFPKVGRNTSLVDRHESVIVPPLTRRRGRKKRGRPKSEEGVEIKLEEPPEKKRKTGLKEDDLVPIVNNVEVVIVE